MENIHIVTSICVDVDENEDIFYPQLKGVGQDHRRLLYWRCVYIFFASSSRCNPDCNHIVYTNDPHDVIENGINLTEKIKAFGVDIRHLPFKEFNPPKGYSKRFKNAFYKLDVIKQLGEEKDGYYLLLDSDCVWAKNDPELYKTLQSDDHVLLYDVDCLLHAPQIQLHNMDRKSVLEVFRQIEPDYPEMAPILFGGEIIGGSNKNLKIVAEDLKQLFEKVIEKFKKESDLPVFPNNRNIFSGMEYFTSLSYNRLPIPWKD